MKIIAALHWIELLTTIFRQHLQLSQPFPAAALLHEAI